MVRLKERYLLVNIVYPDAAGTGKGKSTVPDFVAVNQPTTDALTSSVLARAVKAEVLALFGDCGAGAVERSLNVKYLSHATSTFILRISREHFRLVWAALTFMNRVPVRDGLPCVFRVVHVSGTIRKVEEEAIRRARLLKLAAEESLAGKESTVLKELFGAKGPVAAVMGDENAVDEEDDVVMDG